jgi:hypothetical protein
MMMRLSLIAALLAPVACTQTTTICDEAGFRCVPFPEESSSGDDGGACLDGDEPAVVQIQNRSGNAIETVYFIRCDGTDPSEFPLMPPGLASGEDVEIPLPGPGCWLLDYAGEGCEGEMPTSTEDDVCAGDTFAWLVDDQNHVCAG